MAPIGCTARRKQIERMPGLADGFTSAVMRHYPIAAGRQEPSDPEARHRHRCRARRLTTAFRPAP